MPSATVNVSLADLVRLDEESAKTQKSRSLLIRESLGHKCAPSKACTKEHSLNDDVRSDPSDKKGKRLIRFEDDKWVPFE